MAKSTKKTSNYSSTMDRAYKAARADTKKILNNGAKSATVVNKKVNSDAKNSLKRNK